MKKNLTSPVASMLLALILIFGCLTAQAQTVVEPADAPEDGALHGMTIYFKNNTQKTYTAAELQQVTYLPGIGMKVYVKGSDTSVDYLFSQMTKIDYAYTNANANRKTFSLTDFPYADRLEYPHMSDNVCPTKEGAEQKSQIIVKQTVGYGLTYSLEWDNALVANRWTCYALHAGNTLSNTDRSDGFMPDEEAAVSSQLEDYSGSGFSRGHLCPSADRQCSGEQNLQTFYLTNMQPQWQAHNGGLWKNLEDLVRKYATDASATKATCDTLYVVKAATITPKVTINNQEEDGVYADKCKGTKGIHELIVPKYFYMALLHFNKATNTYKAIAFWTLHKNEGDTNKNYADYAISIDELEKRTGIDFFCNLPDEIETAVEAECDLIFWTLAKEEE